MRAGAGGRHELGQNLLVDRRVIESIAAHVAAWPAGPVTEYAAGRGAVTRSIAARRQGVRAVELDERLARALRRRCGPGVEVQLGDMLTHPLPPRGGVVANVPFHLTTPWLRRLLAAGGWERALLLLQREVARKRAGVGGATLLTAAWWPWYEFALVGRVPAGAFRPRPSVDGGLLAVERRARPLLPRRERRAYQAFAARVFTGPGRGVAAVVARAERRRGAASRMRSAGMDGRAPPRDLGAAEWVALYRWARGGRR
ncbi:23S ribosomal RNA methyltransferase Erm [Miltoncostaea marina]|uniref:23S ribosomal RNA methyltransferase Erm n=1 Tax=Miltoncostaea marina TaxID=2843215 RepID=UPI001C3D7379|nr:rRNA adenine N-6-methyltransferase family protein [Miltoncostaea marina]